MDSDLNVPQIVRQVLLKKFPSPTTATSAEASVSLHTLSREREGPSAKRWEGEGLAAYN